jgi:hypothetical protein
VTIDGQALRSPFYWLYFALLAARFTAPAELRAFFAE